MGSLKRGAGRGGLVWFGGDSIRFQGRPSPQREGENPILFIGFQAWAFSFPIKKYSFKTMVFHREIFPVKTNGFKTMFFYREF